MSSIFFIFFFVMYVCVFVCVCVCVFWYCPMYSSVTRSRTPSSSSFSPALYQFLFCQSAFSPSPDEFVYDLYQVSYFSSFSSFSSLLPSLLFLPLVCVLRFGSPHVDKRVYSMCICNMYTIYVVNVLFFICTKNGLELEFLWSRAKLFHQKSPERVPVDNKS